VNGDESWVPVAILEELFYVLQEALRNSFQHARAGAVICVVDITPSGVSGVVVDDGAGFDTRSADRAGIGLTSMRERVKLIGGYLTITSRPGSGTRVRVSIPLRSRE
jgi:signal transduction histidine kinase